MPEIPTAIEAGLPDFVSQTFFGIFAPAATPKLILEKINAATQSEWADETFQAKLIDSGFETMLGVGPGKVGSVSQTGIRALEPGRAAAWHAAMEDMESGADCLDRSPGPAP